MPAINQITFIVLGIGVAFVVLMLARALILWYFGIQQMLDNQAEIIKQLKLIAGQTRYPTKPPLQ